MTDPLLRYFPQLATVDLESTDTKLYGVLCSFAFFSAIFAVTYLASTPFYTFKNVLQGKDKILWSGMTVRAVYAFSVSSMAAYHLFLDGTVMKDVVHATTTLSMLSSYFVVGYYCFDFVPLFANYTLYGFIDMSIFVHHVFSICLYGSILHYGKGHSALMIGMLDNAPLGFKQINWMLIKAGFGHTILQKLIINIGNFLLYCRTLNELYGAYVIYSNWDHMWANMPQPVFWTLASTNGAMLFVLTPYWSITSLSRRKTKTLIWKRLHSWRKERLKAVEPNDAHMHKHIHLLYHSIFIIALQMK